MRPALVEIETIDKYILHQMGAEDKLVFEAKILLNEELSRAVVAQRKTHKLLRLFWRKQQRDKLEIIYQQLLQEKTFLNGLKAIFS